MAHLLMFDIDGTLTLTNEVDSRCYVQAMSECLDCAIDDDWSQYRNVTDSGIARELLAKHHRSADEAPAVRDRFVSLLVESLATEPECCRQVCGAGRFLRQLRERSDVAIGLATGGWAESALLKLRHAGVNVDDLTLVSADDAEARTEIMLLCEQHAAASANVAQFDTITYFGDAVWDARAAAELGWRFIGIGSGLQAERLQQHGACNVFEDYSDHQNVLHALGLKR